MSKWFESLRPGLTIPHEIWFVLAKAAPSRGEVLHGVSFYAEVSGAGCGKVHLCDLCNAIQLLCPLWLADRTECRTPISFETVRPPSPVKVCRTGTENEPRVKPPTAAASIVDILARMPWRCLRFAGVLNVASLIHPQPPASFIPTSTGEFRLVLPHSFRKGAG